MQHTQRGLCRLRLSPDTSDGCAQGPKRRKATDRRASKGRKLRYHVHEKLVNFMTPREGVGTAPGLASQLFGSLFGRARVS